MSFCQNGCIGNRTVMIISLIKRFLKWIIDISYKKVPVTVFLKSTHFQPVSRNDWNPLISMLVDVLYFTERNEVSGQLLNFYRPTWMKKYAYKLTFF